MGTSGQFVIGGSPRIKVNDGSIGMKWVDEVVFIGGQVHRCSMKWIVLYFNAVVAQLVRVD